MASGAHGAEGHRVAVRPSAEQQGPGSLQHGGERDAAAPAEPFECIACSKPFGTKRMIDAMLGKLAGHPMFGGQGTRRLQMCGDCRVVDIHSNPNELRITDLLARLPCTRRRR